MQEPLGMHVRAQPPPYLSSSTFTQYKPSFAPIRTILLITFLGFTLVSALVPPTQSFPQRYRLIPSPERFSSSSGKGSKQNNNGWKPRTFTTHRRFPTIVSNRVINRETNRMYFASTSSTVASDATTTTELDASRVTLADSYVVHIDEEKKEEEEQEECSTTWRLVPIPKSSDDGSSRRGVGAVAIDALRNAGSSTGSVNPSIVIKGTGRRGDSNDGDDHGDNIITVRIEQMVDDGNDVLRLIATLSRVIAQTLAKRLSSSHSNNNDERWITVSIPSPNNIKTSISERYRLSSIVSPEGHVPLFAPLLPTPTPTVVELSDVVDSDGCPLGYVPRMLMHEFNILHRGIGIVVCRGTHITNRNNNNNGVRSDGKDEEEADVVSLPDVYVHRRTDTKRVFPGLYDMFVGGVSTTGEDSVLTAEREVAEELGLTRGKMSLSEELFRCTVCTAYNRCVVTMFTYRYASGGRDEEDDDEEEEVRWQEEEVAWGDFVPYSIVEKAAEASIRRLKDGGTWPGEDGGSGATTSSDIGTPLSGNDAAEEYQWQTWDFVPDGLLVWEAWVQWMANEKR